MAVATDRYGIEVDVGPGLQALNRFQQQVNNVNQVFGRLGQTIAGIGIGAFIADTIKSAKALDDFSKSSGIALQNLIGFTKAIQQSGANQDQAIDGIGQFNAKLREAALGSKEAQDAFARVGITLDDLRKLSGEALLTKSFEGLAKNTDDVSRLGQQMGLFGESFRIVDTSAQGVVSRLSSATAAAGDNAANIKSAAEAYRSFERAITVLRDVVLITIKPLTDLVAALEIKTETVAGLLKIAAAFLFLTKVVRPMVELWFAFSKGALAAGAAQATFTGAAVAGLAPLRMLGNFAAEMSASFKILFAVWGAQGVSAASKLAISLGALASLASRLAILVTVIVGLNEAIKGLTNFDPIDTLANKLYDLSMSMFPNATKAIDDFGKKLGMASMQEVRAANAAKEHSNVKNEQATAVREVQDALAGEKAALDATLKQYQLQNKLSNDRYKLETSLIGATERRQEVARQLAEVDSNYQQERMKIMDQIAAKERSTSPADLQMIPQLKAALGTLEAEYNKQRNAVGGLADARVKANQAYQIELFSIESLVESNRQLAEIQTQIATATMPELQRRYTEIEAQARASAEAAIAAEEARRRSTLSEAERNKYLEAASQRVRELQAAEYELAKAQQARRLIDFRQQEQNDYLREYRNIAHEIATSTLPQRLKIEQDLAFQADERARAEIAAEEARRGPGYRMSAEEQQKYFDAAREGLISITAATIENYNLQRTWSFGWKTAMQNYVDDVTNGAAAAQRVFQKATQGMEDAIVNFAKTGKFEWKGFINSILEELLRSQVQRLIAQTFGGIGGGGGSITGSLLGGVGKLLGFANGGVIPTNGPVLVGERGPEIISGASGRVVTPNEQLGGGTFVTYNINAVDAMSFKQMLARDPSFLYAVAEQGRRKLPGGRV